ncbi:MAG: hypothetical protein QOJ26_859 [Thermoplasmata archaeon]|nr:hypothetical protein [Thermoplasmata archaeon]
MDPATVARDDLRSYALRRCIRFYSAILVTSVGWTVSRLADGQARGEGMLGAAFLLVVLAAVEFASLVVMAQVAKARDRLGPGPETPLWAFAQGPLPSGLAAVFFLALAAAFAFLGWQA